MIILSHNAYVEQFCSGKNVPFKALGFPSTYEFLLSVPEAVKRKSPYQYSPNFIIVMYFVKVEVQQLPEGNFLLVAVPDEKTEHMARMVSS